MRYTVTNSIVSVILYMTINIYIIYTSHYLRLFHIMLFIVHIQPRGHITEDKIVEEDIEIIGTMIVIEAGIGPEKEYSPGIMVTIGIEVPVIVDQGQDLELILIEI